MKNLKQRIREKHSPTLGGYERWRLAYLLAEPLGYLFLLISAICSAKFYSTFLTDGLGEYAWSAGFVMSLIVSCIIGFLTPRIIAHENADDYFPVLPTAFLILSLGLNFYADFKGAPRYATDLIKEPVNSIPQKVDAALKGIEKREQAIYNKYCWQGKCPNTIAQIEAHTAKHGHTPKADANALKALEKQRQTELQEKSSSITMFDNKWADYISHKEEKESTFKFATVFLNLVYLMLCYWRVNWAIDIANEGNEDTKQAIEDKPKPEVKGDTNTAQTDTEDHWPYSAGIPALDEEHRAMLEKEVYNAVADQLLKKKSLR